MTSTGKAVVSFIFIATPIIVIVMILDIIIVSIAMIVS